MMKVHVFFWSTEPEFWMASGRYSMSPEDWERERKKEEYFLSQKSTEPDFWLCRGRYNTEER